MCIILAIINVRSKSSSKIVSLAICLIGVIIGIYFTKFSFGIVCIHVCVRFTLRLILFWCYSKKIYPALSPVTIIAIQGVIGFLVSFPLLFIVNIFPGGNLNVLENLSDTIFMITHNSFLFILCFLFLIVSPFFRFLQIYKHGFPFLTPLKNDIKQDYDDGITLVEVNQNIESSNQDDPSELDTSLDTIINFNDKSAVFPNADGKIAPSSLRDNFPFYCCTLVIVPFLLALVQNVWNSNSIVCLVSGIILTFGLRLYYTEL